MCCYLEFNVPLVNTFTHFAANLSKSILLTSVTNLERKENNNENSLSLFEF